MTRQVQAFIADLAGSAIPVAIACRVLRVARSTFYERSARVPSARDAANVALGTLVERIHADSRGTYGAPRVHAELRLARKVSRLTSR